MAPKIRKDLTYISKRHKRRLVKNEITNVINRNSVLEYSIEMSSVTSEKNTNASATTNSTIDERNVADSTSNLHDYDEPNVIGNYIPQCSQSISLLEKSVLQREEEQTAYEHQKEEATAQSLIIDLRKWAIESNISKMILTSLLKILRTHGMDVPSDSRVLLHTPRNLKLTNMNPGQYYHFGLKQSVSRSVKKYYAGKKVPSETLISIGIDGLPLTKSSGSQLYPILGALQANFYTEPFIIGVYHGFEKPADSNELVKLFLEDLINVRNDGLLIENQKIHCDVIYFVCDTPAKKYITGAVGHNAYFGCDNCIQEGDYIKNRMTFPEINSVLRTNESFREKIQEEHHKKTSILESAGIGMVSQFPLDYMHLVCLGVMKKKLVFWTKGKKNVRMLQTNLKLASAELIALNCFIPSEFARKPRALEQADRFKATELRQILLYTGVIIFKNRLSNDQYKHFICLSVAIRILSNISLNECYHEYAKELLIYYVQMYPILYGAEHVSYNVHNLIHLPYFVELFGPVDNFSAFKFENYLQKLKKKIKSCTRPLEQLVNRIEEENKSQEHQILNVKTTKFPLLCKKEISNPKQNRAIKHVQFEDFILSTKRRDRFCSLIDGNCFEISEIVERVDKIYLTGYVYIEYKPIFESPSNSTLFGIKLLERECKIPLTTHVSQVKSKLVSLPFNDNELVVLPLLHNE